MLAFKQVNLLPLINPLLQVSVNPEYSKLRIPLYNSSENQLLQFILDVVGENASEVESLSSSKLHRAYSIHRKNGL
jgi:hypothetical protein